MKKYNKPTMDVNEFVIDWSILCSSRGEEREYQDSKDAY